LVVSHPVSHLNEDNSDKPSFRNDIYRQCNQREIGNSHG
jgi:hypothetical protein